MTKKELIEQGKELGLHLDMKMPKAEMESEIEKANEAKKINKSDPSPPPSPLPPEIRMALRFVEPQDVEDLFVWAFGYGTKAYVKGRAKSRFKNLHPDLPATDDMAIIAGEYLKEGVSNVRLSIH